jgi:uncharacterized protein (DUF924 family)
MRPTTSRDWEPILLFWFGSEAGDPAAIAGKQPLWFAADAAIDQEIRRRFGEPWAAATRGELDAWASEPRGGLALVILLDQFSRNLERGRAAAFAHDARALRAASALIDRGEDRLLLSVERSFLYLPFEHAEDLTDQRRSVELFSALVEDAGAEWSWLTEDSLRWARLHLEIIERFGRFPHRNQVLGRRSTPEEERYLSDGGQRFGQ